MSRKTASFLILLIFLWSGCENSPEEFKVKIVDPDWEPVENVIIRGHAGMWDFFGAQTDSRGIATLPGFALGEGAYMTKTNYYPDIISLLPYPPSIPPFTFVITPTPKKLKLIGNIKGWVVRSDAQSLVTVDGRGSYHVYEYSDQGVTEMVSVQIAGDIRKTEVHGNTLWFNSYNDGIYAFSLENPLNPHLLFHLDIPGDLLLYTVKDNILVVGSEYDKAPVRVYTYTVDGDYQEIAQFGNYECRRLTFLSDYLILITFIKYDIYNIDDLYNIYDFQDPASPLLVHSINESDYWFKCFYKDALILHPSYEYYSYEYLEENPALYKLVDLTDPSAPTSRFFLADSEVMAIINDTTAVGIVYNYSDLSVLLGDFVSGFKTVSIIAEYPEKFGGYVPPYFVIAERLWRFE